MPSENQVRKQERNKMDSTDTRPLVRVAAGIVLNENGEFLLSSRPEGKPYAGYWEFAGGKIESGETVFAALQREFEEELGIKIRRAVPWLVKIHSYEHARVHLHFMRVEAQDWSGRLQAREGQKWAWQRAGDFNVSPMLPANAALLKALSVPRRLSGNFTTGFTGENANSEYRVVPYSLAEPQHSNILISETELARSGKMPPAQSVWAVIEHESQWLRVQDADVAVWRVQNETDARSAAQVLQQGAGIPLIIAAPRNLLQTHRNTWQARGAHALIEINETDAV